MHKIDHNERPAQSVLTKSDMSPVDNSLQFALRDKLVAGTLGAEDVGALKTVVASLQQ